MTASSPTARQVSSCYIKPKTSHEVVHLTPWDLIVLSHPYVQRAFFFKHPPQHSIHVFLHKLKESLYLALIQFYTLAGQLETQLDHEKQTSSIFIDCNKGPGARFIHAELDLGVTEITSLNPSSSRQRQAMDSLFDHNDVVNYDGHARPLLTVQVTELTDGVFVSCSVNHVCADGESLWQFLSSWSEIYKDAPISRPPVYERWFIDGRYPIKLPFGFSPNRRSGDSEFEDRVFHFSAESLAKLKSKANSESRANIGQISSFQALAALVWRCITRARSVPEEAYTDCALAFNNRGRLNPPLSQNYFGNCVQLGVASVTAGELLQGSLGWAATKVNEVVAGHNDEKVRERIERWMKNPGGKVYRSGSGDNYNIVMGGSTRFECYGVEFGMGKAVSVISGRGSKREGKVVCSAGRDEEGSVDLEVSLLEKSMAALELDSEFKEYISSTI